jgi:ubiquinone/menaquinone biosynthesis C-methylase UbiE
MAAAAPRTDAEIRDVNERYHDVAAGTYDAKWGISFDAVGQEQVAMKLRKALGREPGRYGRALEIGAGTGYFSLNLLLAGIVGEATCTDISPGMLEALRANAARLGLDIATVPTDAGRLPFADESFDLVFGHAVLHHLPDLPSAFADFRRVLRPGGTVAFAGEPSRYGDRIAAAPKLLARLAAPAWRLAVGARPAQDPGDDDPEHELERFVDIHAFRPADLARAARGAGFEGVRVRGEELVASLFGWTNRALEATAEPGDVPMLWRRYAYHGYLALQQVDTRALEPRLPPELFYNLMVSGRRPG